jgi:transcriptional regulator with XRE-family HTH domain
MRTRIRELRKLRGLTLKELADKIGTTPQTVQRLETANMTVSTGWLEKIAAALHVEPAELISSVTGRDIPFLGRLGANGAIYRLPGLENEALTLDIPAENPVAVRLDIPCGRYEAGAILVGAKLRDSEHLNANGADCLVGLESGVVLLRRVLFSQTGQIILSPLDPGFGADHDQPIAWIARIIVSIRYY